MGIPLAPDRPVTPALALAGIRKQFGSVQALRGADFVLLPGELHALLGENGAGKSTLMKIAFGLLRPDSGTIRRSGRDVAYASPLAARADGIGMVHQHPTSIETLTVAENLAVASGWAVSRPRALEARVRALTERLDLPLDPSARVADLGIALKQRLEIVKALASDAAILLLDEPSAVLAPREADELLMRVQRFCETGGSAVLITHKRSEAIAHADRVTVLRAGAVALSAPAREVTPDALGEAMLGAAAPARATARAASARGPVCVSLAGVRLGREGGGTPALADATIEISAGEIVAIAAVEGNGQRELLRAVAGLQPVQAGTLRVDRPIAFVPEDRSTEGLIGEATLTENVVLGVGEPAPWRHRWTIDWAGAASATEELIRRFNVKASGADAPARSLSGGNQQKILIARALARAPRVLVLENPTRGLDFDATRFVHEQLRAAAAAGAAVLVYSADLDEVLELGDRIVAIAAGVLREAPRGADRALVGALMLGGGVPS